MPGALMDESGLRFATYGLDLHIEWRFKTIQ